jgi:peptide-methionine (R)-S-oxide reductase
MEIDEDNLKKVLTDVEYKVLREKGTEPAFTGHLLKENRSGDFLCKVCNTKIFDSSAKFDSGTGWPSFDSAVAGTIEEIQDLSHGMHRTEVVCSTCRSHLGHVFSDGPTETGQRYCINSVCLGFEPTCD